MFTNNVWQLTRTHRYVYDRWNLVEERIEPSAFSLQPSALRHFTWGLDLSGLSSGAWSQDAGGIGGLLAITEVSGGATNVFLPVSDQVGTVHALVAAVTNNVLVHLPSSEGSGVGFVAARYEYSPYGELLEVLPDPRLFTDHCSLITSPTFGFQSKYRDAETGFWYFGHRFFDSRCAQWLSHDPLREGGGFNLAAFCGGDPVNAVDPLGLQSADEYAAGAYGFNSAEEFRQFMESGDGLLEASLIGRTTSGACGGGGSGFLRGFLARLWGGGKVKALPPAPAPVALLNPPAATLRTRIVQAAPLPTPAMLHGDGFVMVRGPASFSTTGLYRPELAMRVRGGHLPRQALSSAVLPVSSPSAARTSFYVRPDGTVVPGVGYRAIGGPGVQEALAGQIAPRSYPGTYITFDNIILLTRSEAGSVLQLPRQPTHVASFDTLQIVGDLHIPHEYHGAGLFLEPLTISYPGFGTGDGTQAVTFSPIGVLPYRVTPLRP